MPKMTHATNAIVDFTAHPPLLMAMPTTAPTMTPVPVPIAHPRASLADRRRRILLVGSMALDYPLSPRVKPDVCIAGAGR